MKQNKPEKYEPLMVYLFPERTPVAYQNKVDCLKLSGLTEEEARKLALEPIVLELYYEIGMGLFAVEAEAVEGGLIFSPYSKEELIDEEKESEENSIQIVSSERISPADIAFGLVAKSGDIARNGLIEILNQNDGEIEIPEHSGGPFSLCMLGMTYSTFYFSTIKYFNGQLLFTGTNEEDDPINIDESELPDNGLLYLFDYLKNGIY